MNKPVLVYIFLGLGLFLISAGLSFWLFTSLPKSTGIPISPLSASPSPGIRSKLDPSIPRTEICPLNGALFTKQERDVWETRRPLGVMIENSTDSRPQSGLSSADVIYEAVAEGGITRFMAMFYCAASMAGNITIAPVRSARIYFVNLISEYDGLYNHVGGAGNCDDANVDPRAKALCLIRTANIKDLDQFGWAGDFKTCHRMTNRLDHEVAYEHTMACFSEELYKAAAKQKWTNVDAKGISWDKNFISWKFKKAPDKNTGSAARTISYSFWDGMPDYNVSWQYDSASNSYVHSNGGKQSMDLNTEEPLQFSNVVIQFTKEFSTGDVEKHMIYEVIGKGSAIVFMDGVAVDATWSKPTRTSRTIYKDQKGKEITFTPGPLWISILPIGNEVTYN
ncbi:hypothetical protein A3H89_00430 [Candidatus Amesbacteria bacterium RIFCSPLOWO2_02_FULL_48_11]|uniref:DUF3048 domain-containing protein n=3 Tax=Candidatus Amesiibacteriota TaxID=1752730 RepID=A0A1F4Z9T5_9BACT|nr:MAG: hypothetical protein UX78_C0015G0057 [Candidatus Amesbacteria bacterium GW2011_GWA2_47_11]OGD02920.1 MAG: hypothetical protein A2354_02375 [Candidatus Amesbacteria bacterium RIFOXYB1_FULL_47_12]OGD03080.1 MAG: hypothetical protein A3E17_02225 [Candidatus Amesbacteria bacterium RIFCSPHIGHO2_12_FULL_48_14]OGD08073.1 MAG: hypothetical protein A3H89_00430 [Candidatus Amesbacteria bacterium RIFCSPLOWO2_02_FULL_48_11]OGD11810.1 MAG: hypothetical protein A2576_02575 [Candidatus Amesbacteria ba